MFGTVENNSGANRLTGLRGATASCRNRYTKLSAHAHSGCHIVRCCGKRDHEWNDLIDAGVRCVKRPADTIITHIMRANRLRKSFVQLAQLYGWHRGCWITGNSVCVMRCP